MKKKLFPILCWIIGIGSLYVYFTYYFSWGDAKQIIANIKIATLVIAIACFLVAYSLRAIKWTYILRSQDNISWHSGFHTVMATNLANFVSPVRVGEILKLVMVKKNSGIPYSTSTAISLVDNFSFMLFILSFVFLTPFAGLDLPPWASDITPYLFVILFISIAFFILGTWFADLIRKWSEKCLGLFGIKQAKTDNLLNSKIFLYIENILKQCHISTFSKTNVLLVVLISYIVILFDGLAIYFLIKCFGLSITYFHSILATCFFYFLVLVPAPPGKVGTSEIFPLLVFSGIFHLPSNVISTLALFWHLVVAIILVLFGTYSTVSLGLQLKTVFNFSTDAEKDITV